MTEIGMEEGYLFILKAPLLMIGYLTVILNQHSLETVSIQIKPKCAKSFAIIA